MEYFTKNLLNWHRDIDRNMPWKQTDDVYKIWISEIILQQTRVKQGTDYYLNFINTFPDIKSLANAKEDEVLKAWEGLGYYSRARNLHHAAKDIMSRFDGKFPTTHEDIISLKGIGNYTAAAIASFGYGLPHAVIDGNVNRVLSRFLGYTNPIDTTEGKKYFMKMAHDLLDKQNPAAYNQAIMDFGALQCTPKNPNCMYCPLQTGCKAYSEGLVKMLPIKEKKIKIRKRHLHYFLYHSEDEILLQQRSDSGIWAKLYELPLLETDEKKSKKSICDLIITESDDDIYVIKTEIHKLTHQHLYITFYKIDHIPSSKPFNFCKLEKVKDLHNFALPKPISLFLKELLQIG